MRIYWIDNLETGCGHVRTVLPAQELMRRGHTCTITHGKYSINTGEWDTLALGRLVTGDIQNALPEIRRRGLKIVYDLDDALDLLEPDNPVYPHIMSNIDAYFWLLRFADLVTVTTHELAGHVRMFVPDSTGIAVLPNSVRESEWRRRKGGNAIPRIGFAGSNSHLGNLRELLEAIRRLQRNDMRDRFEFVLFGISSLHESFDEYCEASIKATDRAAHTIFRETLVLVRNLLSQVKHTWVRGVPIESYRERLSSLNLDLGLCPVRVSNFNRFKSCLKAYEYAMVGTEVMCSLAKPYADELPATVFPMVAHDAEEWSNAIADWIADFSDSKDSAKAIAQRDWVLEHGAIEKNGQLWETAFAELAKEK